MGRGKLTVITGPMASGKTAVLLMMLGESSVLFENILLFKHEVDTRDGANRSSSRLGLHHEAITVSSSSDIVKIVEETDPEVIAVEEAQFFHESPLAHHLDLILRRGTHVVVTCLNLSSKGTPFKEIPRVMAMADDIVHRKAVCTNCGGVATRTQRFVNGVVEDLHTPIIQVDGTEDAVYAPRCIECWEEPKE